MVSHSGTIQKIHTRKIDRAQGREHAWKYYRIYDPGAVDEHVGTLQSQGVRADAQCFIAHPEGLETLFVSKRIFHDIPEITQRPKVVHGPRKIIQSSGWIFTRHRGSFGGRTDITIFMEHFRAIDDISSGFRLFRIRVDLPRCHGKFSKFFGPSPRNHWLTVYRGLQVW